MTSFALLTELQLCTHNKFAWIQFLIWLKALHCTLFPGDVKWQEGRVSGAIYNGGKELTEILTKVRCKQLFHNEELAHA